MAAIVGISLALLGYPAFAHGQDALEETTTVNMDVSFSIEAACTLSAEALDFGQAVGVSAGIHYAESVITVTCPDTVPYEVGISPGENSISTGFRTVTTESGDAIVYDLFMDSERSLGWGDGQDLGPRKQAVGTGTEQTHTVFGELRRSSDRTVNPVGDYSDTVVVSIFL